MGHHVVIGAGPVGTATARELVAKDHEVTVASRGGRAVDHPGVRSVALDATDRDALLALTTGAEALYNCANPAYHRWSQDWPPIAAALLTAAQTTGAVLVTMSNLYGYGPVDHPMTESDPLAATGRKGRIRAGMWTEALAAHRAGRVRACEARASDFFGPEVLASHVGERVAPRLLTGRPVWVVGDPGVPHSWTYVPDVGRTLATLGTSPAAWGRAWHVPTNPPLSQRQYAEQFSQLAGAPAPTVRGLPRLALRAAGLVLPLLRELDETWYQFDRPFVMDSDAATDAFGITATPIERALTETVAWWRDRGSKAGAAVGTEVTPLRRS